MSTKTVLRRGLRATRRALCSEPARAVLRRFGLRSTLASAYWRAVYRLAGGRCEQEVAGARVAFRASSPTEFRHYRTFVGERPVLADLLGRLEADDVFFDVGAYVGVYACFVAAVLPLSRVVAFEPRADRAARIEENFAANGFEASVRRQALSDDAGPAWMSATGGSARVVRGVGDGERVETVAGDALVEAGELPRPTVVKLDVEGGELDAVRGMKRTLAESCRLLYCEVHPTLLGEYGATEAELREELLSLGFRVERIHHRGEEYFLRCEN